MRVFSAAVSQKQATFITLGKQVNSVIFIFAAVRNTDSCLVARLEVISAHKVNKPFLAIFNFGFNFFFDA